MPLSQVKAYAIGASSTTSKAELSHCNIAPAEITPSPPAELRQPRRKAAAAAAAKQRRDSKSAAKKQWSVRPAAAAE